MIDYGKSPDNQMQLEIPGMTAKGQERMDEARKFKGENFDLWQRYLQIVREDMARWPDGKASPNDCLTLFKMKHRRELSERRCALRDNTAAYLARVAMEENPRLYRFRIAKCDGDGFVQAVL